MDERGPVLWPNAVHNGRDIVQLKVLSDRRSAGGCIAWLVKWTPPPGKLIKIVAKALSDEHVFNLEGGRATKAGTPVRANRKRLCVPTVDLARQE
jgi:hypothetical protein